MLLYFPILGQTLTLAKTRTRDYLEQREYLQIDAWPFTFNGTRVKKEEENREYIS
jgi:hypothetical protein